MTTDALAGLLEQAAADPNPASFDLSQPCPDDVHAAVAVLWHHIGRIRAELDQIAGQQHTGRM